MSRDLKQTTMNSIIWNTTDKVAFQIIAFIVGILTARMLSPKDFGLIGALAVFTILSNALVEGGFTAALVRRKQNTNSEYTAAFYFNLFLSLLLYCVLFFFAPFIASYFQMPELCSLSRFLFLAIILNSFSLIQNIILTKNFSFRTLAIANLASVTLSGGITIILTFLDFGYWALAWQQILQVSIRSLLLWILSSWRISKKTDFKVIKELFSFSFILLITSIITTIVKYVYNIIIGKSYSIQDLGYYSQAFKYQQIPASIISSSISGVAYPALVKLNDDNFRQLRYFRKLIRITAFAIFPIMFGMCLMADNLVIILLTEKWLPAVPYFRILVISAIFNPFHVLNLTALNVKGFPKRNFTLEMIRNILIILSLFLYNSSIEHLLIGFSIANLVSCAIDLFFIRKILNYKIKEQLMDIFPYLFLSGIMCILIYFLSNIMNIYISIIIQFIAGVSFYFLSLYFTGSTIFKDIIDMFIKKKTTKT